MLNYTVYVELRGPYTVKRSVERPKRTIKCAPRTSRRTLSSPLKTKKERRYSMERDEKMDIGRR